MPNTVRWPQPSPPRRDGKSICKMEYKIETLRIELIGGNILCLIGCLCVDIKIAPRIDRLAHYKLAGLSILTETETFLARNIYFFHLSIATRLKS